MAVKTNDKEEKEIRVNRRIVCKFGGDLYFSFFFFSFSASIRLSIQFLGE